MRLTITTFLTLDGVYQAPGGPEEDPSGGFRHGGWSFPYADEGFGEAVVGWFENADAFLLGRKTYEIFESYWPNVTDENDPVASKLNGREKYVVSSTLGEPTWQHTTVIRDGLVGAVRRLKEQPGNELQVHGSGQLAKALIAANLVDEYRLMVYPVVLGTGRRLFGEETTTALRLVGATTTKAGVAILTYVPDGPPRYGSFAAEPGG